MELICIPIETRVVEAMRQVMHQRRVVRVYPYQVALWSDIGYSEPHLRRVMARLAKENVITRVGGDNSRRGYALQ
jgi:hypothetical protein